MRASFLPIMVASALAVLAVTSANPIEESESREPRSRLGKKLRDYMSGQPRAALSSGVISLQAQGKRDKLFTIIVDNGVSQVVEGDADGAEPDVTIIGERKNLRKIARGKMSLMQAYEDKMIQVEGDIDIVKKL